jgi:arabinose-5-phosphate isomerase
LKENKSIKEIAIRTINEEGKAVAALANSINDDFVKCVELIFHSKGRVVVTGIGKSAIIGAKLVASLNSTGTPSIFMHAADAIHGDLGTIQKEDIIICISKSGETPEIRILVPLLKDFGSSLIAIVGNPRSYLGKQADYILDTTVKKEACPNNLAPTSSTTAQMVMGDALTVCLLEYAVVLPPVILPSCIPAGHIGKQLYLKVADLYINNQVPKVEITDNIKTIILEISSKRC